MTNLKKSSLLMLKLTLGCLIYVIGINLFLVPAGIFTTGLMGIAQELAQTINLLFDLNLNIGDAIFKRNQTIIYWLMNLPMIIFGFKKLGKKFTLKTLLVSLVIVQIFINIITIDHSLIIDNGEIDLASQLISAIFGSILIGVGMGIVINSRSSMGGTDILATYLSVYKGKSFGIYNLGINMIVVIWAVILTQDLTNGILILMSLYIQSRVVDMVYDYNSKEVLLIVTKEKDKVGDYIIRNDRSYNILESTTGYTKKKANILHVIVNKEERAKFTKNIIEIDQDAFISVMENKAIIGNFNNVYQSNLD